MDPDRFVFLQKRAKVLFQRRLERLSGEECFEILLTSMLGIGYSDQPELKAHLLEVGVRKGDVNCRWLQNVFSSGMDPKEVFLKAKNHPIAPALAASLMDPQTTHPDRITNLLEQSAAKFPLAKVLLAKHLTAKGVVNSHLKERSTELLNQAAAAQVPAAIFELANGDQEKVEEAARRGYVPAMSFIVNRWGSMQWYPQTFEQRCEWMNYIARFDASIAPFQSLLDCEYDDLNMCVDFAYSFGYNLMHYSQAPLTVRGEEKLFEGAEESTNNNNMDDNNNNNNNDNNDNNNNDVEAMSEDGSDDDASDSSDDDPLNYQQFLQKFATLKRFSCDLYDKCFSRCFDATVTTLLVGKALGFPPTVVEKIGRLVFESQSSPWSSGWYERPKEVAMLQRMKSERAGDEEEDIKEMTAQMALDRAWWSMFGEQGREQALASAIEWFKISVKKGGGEDAQWILVKFFLQPELVARVAAGEAPLLQLGQLFDSEEDPRSQWVQGKLLLTLVQPSEEQLRAMMQLFEDAAKAGFRYGGFDLGMCLIQIMGRYEEGKGWIAKGAALGDVRAQEEMGNLILDENPDYDDQTAVRAMDWYKQAAMGGIPNAQLMVGSMYGDKRVDAEEFRINDGTDNFDQMLTFIGQGMQWMPPNERMVSILELMETADLGEEEDDLLLEFFVGRTFFWWVYARRGWTEMSEKQKLLAWRCMMFFDAVSEAVLSATITTLCCFRFRLKHVIPYDVGRIIATIVHETREEDPLIWVGELETKHLTKRIKR
jgi:TPR repeat protein